MTTDVEMAATFLHHLYGAVERGWVQINHDTGGFDTEWFDAAALDIEEMARFAVDVRPRTGVWVPIATRSEWLARGVRGGADQCAEVLALVADIDVANGYHDKLGLPPTLIEARVVLDGLPLPPTALVETGGGLQAWWMLSEPVAATEAAEVVGRFGASWPVRAAQRGWTCDNVGTIEHVFRLPGTWNGRAQVMARTVSADWDRRYSLDDLDQYSIEAPTVTTRTFPRAGIPLGEPPGDWYNATHDVDGLLVAAGCVLLPERTAKRGRPMYCAPHHVGEHSPPTGIEVYNDPEGEHAVIWSATFAAKLGVDGRASLDSFGLFARLHHGGDFEAAARAAKSERGDSATAERTGTVPTLSAIADKAEPTNLPEGFWTARGVHAHIRQAAHAAGRSADALLAVVLGRVACTISPYVVLPAIVGSTASLDSFFVLVAAAGAGKSNAVSMGRALYPFDAYDIDPATTRIVDDFQLRSAEGLTDAWLKPNEPKKPRERGPVSVLVHIDEGEMLAKIGKDNILFPTLRSAWSGETLGQGNATTELRRRVQGGTYRLVLIIAVLTKKAHALLDDAAGGLPQRFVFAAADDPHIPKPGDRPKPPGPLKFTRPTLSDYPAPITRPIEVPQSVREEIMDADALQHRGLGSELDAHRNLCRLKVACLLAALDGRAKHVAITEGDWHLAGMLMDVSANVRASVQRAAVEEHRKADQVKIDFARQLSAGVEDDQAVRSIRSGALAMARFAHRRPDETFTEAVMSRAMAGKTRREVTDAEVLAYAQAQKWIAATGAEWGAGVKQPPASRQRG